MGEGLERRAEKKERTLADHRHLLGEVMHLLEERAEAGRVAGIADDGVQRPTHGVQRLGGGREPAQHPAVVGLKGEIPGKRGGLLLIERDIECVEQAGDGVHAAEDGGARARMERGIGELGPRCGQGEDRQGARLFLRADDADHLHRLGGGDHRVDDHGIRELLREEHQALLAGMSDGDLVALLSQLVAIEGGNEEVVGDEEDVFEVHEVWSDGGGIIP